jgi:ribonuclease P/MRP protein subunit RPP40
VNDLASNMDAGQQTDVVLLNLSKACVKVPHCRLLEKLQFYGVMNNTLTWITTFLYNRNHVVQLGGASSSRSAVDSGVPKGSVLGHLLFLLYINDLQDEVSVGTAADCGG